MNTDKKNSQIKISKKSHWLSFRELNTYFTNPDSQIQNISAISAQQFAKDLDFIIDFSRNNLALQGSSDEFSIMNNINSSKKEPCFFLMRALQKNGPVKWYNFLNRFFKHKNPQETKVTIKSWHFTDFDDTEKFQVRQLYTIKPVSLTYHVAQHEHKYDNQIISEFSIEEANGIIKKLKITDTIKNGKVKREKHINGQNITRQHYPFEIRSHQLNRGLMKTFLFHQMSRYENREYGQNSRLNHDDTDMGFAVVQAITKATYMNALRSSQTV